MSNNKIPTFFPGERKQMKMSASGSGPLKDTTGMRRIRLAVSMSLSNGKLKGMPEWIGDTYALVAKENGPTDRSPITRVQLDGVNCDIYTTNQTIERTMKIPNCNLSAFVLTRGKEKKNGEMASVDLHFTLKTAGWLPELWTWIGDNLDAEFWMGFEGSQILMTFKNPMDQADEELEEAEKNGTLIVAADYERQDSKPAETKPKPALKFMSKAQRDAEAALGGTVN